MKTVVETQYSGKLNKTGWVQREYRDRDEKNFTWYLIIVKLHCFYDHNRDLYENNLHCISSKQSIVLMRIGDKGIQLEKLTIQ